MIVTIGCEVCVKSKNGIETFKICGTTSETTYVRMGGAYDESTTLTHTFGTHIIEKNGDNIISSVSPMGEALLNKTVGDIVNIKLPDGSTEEYLILQIS